MKTLVTLLAAGALALSTGALAAKPTAAKAIKDAKAAIAKTDAVGFLWLCMGTALWAQPQHTRREPKRTQNPQRYSARSNATK